MNLDWIIWQMVSQNSWQDSNFLHSYNEFFIEARVTALMRMMSDSSSGRRFYMVFSLGQHHVTLNPVPSSSIYFYMVYIFYTYVALYHWD
jgi:hypothetical protein